MSKKSAKFSTQVKNWGDRTKDVNLLIMKQSLRDMLQNAQRPVRTGGRMPVDTGFLRNSLQAGLNASTAFSGPIEPGQYLRVIDQLKAGDTFVAAWMAPYAGFVEFGTTGQPARRFLGAAMAQWSFFVKQNTTRFGLR